MQLILVQVELGLQDMEAKVRMVVIQHLVDLLLPLVVVEEELVTVLLEEIEMEIMEGQEVGHRSGVVLLALELQGKVMREHLLLEAEIEAAAAVALVALVE
tara:strand:- start:312 stop:614 length:303 start_codon:yes stop_codon:yes gene_type:complete